MLFTTILCHSQKSPSNQETPQNQVFLIFSINYIKYLSSMGDMFILLPEPLDLSTFAPLLEVLLHGFCTVFSFLFHLYSSYSSLTIIIKYRSFIKCFVNADSVCMKINVFPHKSCQFSNTHPSV